MSSKKYEENDYIHELELLSVSYWLHDLYSRRIGVELKVYVLDPFNLVSYCTQVPYYWVTLQFDVLGLNLCTSSPKTFMTTGLVWICYYTHLPILNHEECCTKFQNMCHDARITKAQSELSLSI